MVSGGPQTRFAQLTAQQRRRLVLGTMLRIVAAVTLLVALYYVLPLDREQGALFAVAVPLGFIVLVGVIAWQVRAILSAEYPGLYAAEALAIIVPLFLITFAAVYFVMEGTWPKSFNQHLTRTDSLYFALTVFSTVGFGDITATSETARILVMIQMVADILAIGLGLRLITTAVQRARSRQPGSTAGGDGR